MIRDTADKPPGDGTTIDVACGTTREGQHASILLRFDIDTLPTNATVTNVSLRLVVNQAPSGGETASFSLHRMFLRWDEFSANWNTTGLVDWSGPGGVAGVDFVAAPSATAIISNTGPYVFSSPNLLAEVLLWITNRTTNNGWIVLCDTNLLHTAKRFDTREHPDSAVRPQLVLDYRTPLTLIHPRVENDQFAFDFVASPGTNYTVQYKDNLASSWLDFLYFPDPGQETTNTVTDAGGLHRFFRVVKSP
jgi:hypothetical protein